ncbi:MAG: TonB-dependent receptor plug domain-containing protein [Saprospiraceae bacterium]
MPALAGEVDLLKGITLYPGITTTVEGTANLQVRGGSYDQTQIIADGSPIYYANHLGGFLSSIPPFSVKAMNIYKGGIPPNLGGRLSGVLDMIFSEGQQNGTTGELSVGTLTARGGVKTHIGKKSTIGLSARYAYPSLLVDLAESANYKKGLEGSKSNLRIFDVVGKYVYRTSEKSNISLTWFESGDNGIIQEASSTQVSFEQFNWGNRAVAIKYFHALGNGWSLSVNPFHAKFRYDLSSFMNDIAKPDTVKLVSSQGTYTAINDYGLHATVSGEFSENRRLKFGFSSVFHRFSSFSVGTKPYSEETVSRFTSLSDGHEQALFGNYESGLFDQRLHLNIGIRASRFTGNLLDKNWTLEPRVRLKFNITDFVSFNAGFDKNVQYVHQLQAQGALLPNDIWVLADEKARASKSSQYYLGLSGDIGDRGLQWFIEGYTKQMINLVVIAFETQDIYSDERNWSDLVYAGGTGKARGLEAWLAFNPENTRWNGSLSYTLSKSDRLFPQIDNGQLFPFTYDRRHVANLNLSYSPNEKWDFSALWQYATGHAITLPTARGLSYLVFSGYNRARMPNYHRLDLGVNYQWKARKNPEIRKSIRFSLYNAYNRANPHEIVVRPTQTETINPQTGLKETVTEWNAYQLSLFPVLPGISYEVKFTK